MVHFKGIAAAAGALRQAAELVSIIEYHRFIGKRSLVFFKPKRRHIHIALYEPGAADYFTTGEGIAAG